MFLPILFVRFLCRSRRFSVLFSAVIITTPFSLFIGTVQTIAQDEMLGQIMEPDSGGFRDDGIYRLEPDERIREALRQIRKDLAGDLTQRERARLLRSAAQLESYFGNFHNALRDIEASFETGILTDNEKAENYFFAAKVFLLLEPPDLSKAMENLRKHIELAKNPDPDAYYLVGHLLAQKKNCEEAIFYTRKAIELSRESKEKHYQLSLYCYNELKWFEDQMALLERMTKLFPANDKYVKMLEEVRRKMKPPAN